MCVLFISYSDAVHVPSELVRRLADHFGGAAFLAVVALLVTVRVSLAIGIRCRSVNQGCLADSGVLGWLKALRRFPVADAVRHTFGVAAQLGGVHCSGLIAAGVDVPLVRLLISGNEGGAILGGAPAPAGYVRVPLLMYVKLRLVHAVTKCAVRGCRNRGGALTGKAARHSYEGEQHGSAQ